MPDHAHVLMWNDTPISCSTNTSAVQDMELARTEFANINHYTHHGGNLYTNKQGTKIYLTIYQVRSPS